MMEPRATCSKALVLDFFAEAVFLLGQEASTRTVQVTLGDLVGQGASAVVHAVNSFVKVGSGYKHEADGEADDHLLVAKIFRLEKGTGVQPVELAIHEARILAAARGHPSIVCSYGLFRAKSGVSQDLLGTFARKVRPRACQSRRVLPGDVDDLPMHFLVMERCECSLRDLKGLRDFTEPEAAVAVAAVLRALAHLHRLRIVHRDVKHANVMVADGGNRVVLADLELAAEIPPDDATIDWPCGTLGFMAPEVHAFQKGSSASDIFSLGVLLYLLVTGFHPFLEDTLSETCEATLRRQIPTRPAGVLANTSQACVCLLEDLLDRDLLRRITAEEALMHPWMCLEEHGSLCRFVEEFVSCAGHVQTDTSAACAEEPSTRPPKATPRERSIWKLWRSMISVASTTASRVMGSNPLGRAKTQDFDPVHP
ncbi:dapk-1 [Symbiodinium natans]|uniref:Dapk-1 protein n=1 Tax=Symbiodinium natans TaxID=878477 RepID=A0A812LGI9_9DINO|nr:dapk-1 [Symbiodinium natans]